jgi:hypothetical protein
VKTCGYCGRENDDRAGACAGCGTEFEEAPVLPPKTKGRRWGAELWLRYAGYALGVVLFYFLSFGPVMYFFSKVTITSGTVGSTVSVQLPTWAFVVYYPAFYTALWAEGTYGAYVHWWVKRQQGTN